MEIDDAGPIGLAFRIRWVPFEVVEITAAKGMDANGVDQDDLILVPRGSATRRLFNVDQIHTIYVQAQGAELLDRAEEEIRKLLRQRHRRRGPGANRGVEIGVNLHIGGCVMNHREETGSERKETDR